jgi:hypothetical protein
MAFAFCFRTHYRNTLLKSVYFIVSLLVYAAFIAFVLASRKDTLNDQGFQGFSNAFLDYYLVTLC